MPYKIIEKLERHGNYEYWNVDFNYIYVCSRFRLNFLYRWFNVLLVNLENCKKNQTRYTII